MENNEDKRQYTVIAEAIDGINQILYEQSSHDYEVDIPRIMEFLESLLPKERGQRVNDMLLGFSFSGEGFNAEYGCDLPENKEYLIGRFNETFKPYEK